MRGGDIMKNKQNITLSLPKDLLIKAKHLAIDKHTSVSALLAKFLETLVDDDEKYKKAMRHYKSILDQEHNLNNGEEISWKREDLHDRQ